MKNLAILAALILSACGGTEAVRATDEDHQECCECMYERDSAWREEDSTITYERCLVTEERVPELAVNQCWNTLQDGGAISVRTSCLENDCAAACWFLE